MAINTAARRMSAMTVGGLAGYVYPGTSGIDQAERQDALAVYRGILSGTPVEVDTLYPPRNTFMVLFGIVFREDY